MYAKNVIIHFNGVIKNQTELLTVSISELINFVNKGCGKKDKTGHSNNALTHTLTLQSEPNVRFAEHCTYTILRYHNHSMTRYPFDSIMDDESSQVGSMVEGGAVNVIDEI